MMASPQSVTPLHYCLHILFLFFHAWENRGREVALGSHWWPLRPKAAFACVQETQAHCVVPVVLLSFSLSAVILHQAFKSCVSTSLLEMVIHYVAMNVCNRLEGALQK